MENSIAPVNELRQPVQTLEFSIGPAVDLAKLDAAFKEWAKTPWDDPTAPFPDA
jgi:hypothetical protein